MNTIANTYLPVIAGVEITTDAEGRFNLNALHKASSMGEDKAPSQWLRRASTKELVEELSVNSHLGQEVVKSVKGGTAPGTFAHELLAVEYAGWISPAFRLKVNQTFIDFHRQRQPKTQAEILAEMALLNVEQERRLSSVEGQVETVAETVENIKKGTMRAGYVGYRQIVAQSGMSNAKCRNLVNAYSIPTDTHSFLTPDGLLSHRAIVELEPFMKAFRQMMAEAEPRGVRWYHPKMGLFQVIGWTGN